MNSSIFCKKTNKKNIIYSINCEILDDEIFQILSNNFTQNKNIGLDMTNVASIKSKKFIRSLKNKKFKLFNLQNDMLVYLSIILKDGLLNSYLCKNDFIADKYELTKRHFFVV